MLSVIAAIDDNNAIGFENRLLFHIPQDMRRFKRLTLNKTVIMGKKTYDSLRMKPLPQRRNIVLSRSKPQIDAVICKNLDELKIALNTNEEAFVIGGESIYRLLLPYCAKAYITHIISTAAEFDAVFPTLPSNWVTVYKSRIFTSENGIRYRYITYRNQQPETL
ncbi:MAG: dihydrofolate reductase [Oscillospiraceae bacterium]|nr:dihydrofolate reductase [Oscillospiraceae bacterium]